MDFAAITGKIRHMTKGEAMDLVTFTAILTLASGQPVIWQTKVPAEMCERQSLAIRLGYTHAIAWCRSEIDNRVMVIAR